MKDYREAEQMRYYHMLLMSYDPDYRFECEVMGELQTRDRYGAAGLLERWTSVLVTMV